MQRVDTAERDRETAAIGAPCTFWFAVVHVIFDCLDFVCLDLKVGVRNLIYGFIFEG